MLRSIVAVIAGYVAMFLVVMIGFAPAAIAPSFVWRGQDTLDLTTGFVVTTLLASLLAALAGGYVCAWIGRSFKPVIVLAALATLLGLTMAIQNTKKEQPSVTPDKIAAMSYMEKGQISREPDWYAFTTPVICLVGVLLGGKLRVTK